MDFKNSAGTYQIENDALVWSLGCVVSDDARQEFISVKFNPGQISVIHSQIKCCLLEFESDDTRLSRTRIRTCQTKSETVITNR